VIAASSESDRVLPSGPTQDKSFSRRMRVRVLPTALTKYLPKQGRRSADRRTFHCPRHTFRCCHLLVLRARQRSHRRPLAFRRSTAALATQINAMAQPRPCFLGRTDVGRYPPPLSQSSEAPRGPVIMPADPMPRPPGSGVTSPARRNRTRSVFRCVSRARPFGERDSLK
jgi:hypothetical protein